MQEPPNRNRPLIVLIIWLACSFISYFSLGHNSNTQKFFVTAKERAGRARIHAFEEALGPNGILIIGVIGTILIAYWLVKTHRLQRAYEEDRQLSDLKARQWAKSQQLHDDE